MKIHKAYRFKLEPTKEQIRLLKQACGCQRFVYNHYLKKNMEQYEQDKTFVFYHAMATDLPNLKQQFPFLRDAFSQSLQTTLRHLDRAFKNFFKGAAEFPAFKKKNRHDSFTCPQKFRIAEKVIFIPKIGEVRYRKSRQMEGKVKSITITQNCGRWFVSVLTEQEIVEPTPTYENPVGIDVGLKEFVFLSDGTSIANPKYYRQYQEKLAKEQRKLAKKQKFSKNWHKQLRKVQNVHYKIRNSRQDFLHQVSTKIVKNHDIICMEDLHVKGLVKNRKLAKSIADAGWDMLKNMIAYKASWANRTLVQVERFYPSTQECSACGGRKLMPLHLRTYVCESCNTTIDRDYNASLNIERRGLEILGFA
ncbi:RNA-guided endonuclease TnpB family protein [Effusibacillus lacus]|uniref:Transposase n=1 Tax=Effusibacillus lacus TaxID=1348429 RepID=A0A292YNT5_9BACL|nr:RNA-guided endonuclease TnpB family protein [Effusibacillus lacus]TCS71640.1 putative transposase [Effusibacillus lacus]GAX90145.1 transposase [Effusibacillus lacus]